MRAMHVRDRKFRTIGGVRRMCQYSRVVNLALAKNLRLRNIEFANSNAARRFRPPHLVWWRMDRGDPLRFFDKQSEQFAVQVSAVESPAGKR